MSERSEDRWKPVPTAWYLVGAAMGVLMTGLFLFGACHLLLMSDVP